MTKEELFFIKILSDFLNERQTVAPVETLDWNIIVKLAHAHQTSGILYYQCGEFMPSELEKFQCTVYAKEQMIHSKRVKLTNQIFDKLCENKIPFLTFKGLNVAKFYPVMSLRTMGDCDILVHPEDKEKADEVFRSFGYSCTDYGTMEWAYNNKDNVAFELHHNLMYNQVYNYDMHKEFMKLSWDYAKTDDNVHYYLDWNYHFVFLILHLRKHFIKSGVGFRQFMDVALVATKCDLDWDWINKKLEELDVSKFANICFALCEYCFKLKIPTTVSPLSDTDYIEACKVILDNGTFGSENRNNMINGVIFAMRDKKKPKHYIVKRFISIFFPSYKILSNLKKYSFLKGKPYLLPIAWIYRVFSCITRGRVKVVFSSLKLYKALTKENTEKQINKLNKWGL